MGDNMQYYILCNVAKRHNKTVTFMPKLIFADVDRACIRTSLWKDESRSLPGTATQA
jgi:glutamine synthetase